jgi:3-oxoacyl-[acyl-carrier protein] reductase
MKKIVWITGGTKGIGLAIAKELAQKDYLVIISGRNEPSEKVDNTFYVRLDITKADRIVYAFSEIKSKYGDIDILINNAGVHIAKEIEESTINDYNLIFDTNVGGPLFTTKAVLPDMIKKQKGLIININSVAAEKNYPKNGLYSATKSAFLKISEAIREENRNNGIDVVDFLPGATSTDLWPEDLKEEYKHKMMKAEDIALAVSDLISLSGNSSMTPEKIILRPKLGDI